jgi:hypothetical protein
MSNSTILSPVLAGMLTAALLTIVILVARVGRLGQQITEFRRRDAAVRSDAGKRPRLLHLDSISQQLAPLLPGFRYNPKDVQWIGGGAVDAVVWNGLQAGGDVEIVFLDLKPGPHAPMTSNERRIREAIAWKRVAFDEYRPPEAPLLLEALPPETSDDEHVRFPEYRVEQIGPEAGANDVTLPDLPLPFMNQTGWGRQPGS